MLLTKTHQITQKAGCRKCLILFFYKIVILFHSSLTLSTIKRQLFAMGVKFGLFDLFKTKLGHSLL